MRQVLTSVAVFAALTAAASAADLPRRAAPPVFTPVPVFTWSGFYVGVNAGYAFTTGDAVTSSTNPALDDNVAVGGRARFPNVDANGFTGGGQVGYNYQFTPGSGFVVGIEADAAYTDLDSRRSFITGSGRNVVQNRLDYLGTVRGRVGYAFDRVLFYGTAGFAYGNVRSGANFFNDTAGGALAYTGFHEDFRTGYAVGGGVEYALPTDSFLNFFKSSAVTIKTEALYYDLGSRNVRQRVTSVVFTPPGYNTRFETSGALVRVGINYKF